MTERRLTGDHNQCRGCGQYFNSTSAFDKHRTGEHTNNQRRCLTPLEMTNRGMVVNARGFWITAPLPTPYLAEKTAKTQVPLTTEAAS